MRHRQNSRQTDERTVPNQHSLKAENNIYFKRYCVLGFNGGYKVVCIIFQNCTCDLTNNFSTFISKMSDSKPYGTLTNNMVDQSPNNMYNIYRGNCLI